MRLDFKKIVNKSFRPFFYNENRKAFVYGGAGAGKSHAIDQKFIWRCLLSKFPLRFLFFRKYTPELKISMIPLTLDYLDEWEIPYDFNRAELNLKLNKSLIMFRGLDRHAKLKSAEKIDGIWIEELTEFKREEFIQLNLRMRGIGKTYKQIVGSFNPEDKFSWLAEMIDLNQVWHQRYTYKDNEFIDEEYKAELEDLINQDDNFYRIYTLGEWGELKNLIYERCTIEEFDVDDKMMLFGGIDWGFTSLSVWLKIGFKDNTFYIIDEIAKSKLLNVDFMKLVKEKYIEANEQYWKYPIWVDNAEPDKILEFSREKFAVIPCIKSVPVKVQIDWLKRYNFVIHPRCVNTVKEIRTYKWREIGGIIIEEPVKVKDHSMKAMQYGCYGFLVKNGLISGGRKDKPIFGKIKETEEVYA